MCAQVLVAQRIAHQTSNLGVAGSNPVECVAFLCFTYIIFFFFAGKRGSAQNFTSYASIAQLVEHAPRKRKVTSSILVGGWNVSGPVGKR